MEPPIKPDESDCCNSGCNPCILDVYENRLKKYDQRNDYTYNNCLLTTAYTIFKVTNIEKHSNDGILLTFEFVQYVKRAENNNDNLKVLYNPGQYFMLKAGYKNDEFQRPYTPVPINHLNDLQFTILVKLYEVGQMSRYIKRLKVGSTTTWRGPYGHFLTSYSYKRILLIGQGVGIAPLYSIISDILKNENCDTLLKLFYCCKSCDSVYLRDELYNLQSNWNFSYEVFLSLTENTSAKYNEIIHGYKLDDEFLKKYLSDKCDDTQVLICGSEKFMAYFKEVVTSCGIAEKNIVLF